MKPILTVDVGGCFAFSPDSSRIAVAKKSVGKKMGKVVDIATGDEVVSIDRLPANTREIAYAPSGRYLVFGSMYEGVTVVDPSTGTRLQRTNIAGGEIRDLVFAPDDSDTLIHVTRSQISQIAIASGGVARTFPIVNGGPGLPAMYESAAFNRTGDRLVITSAADQSAVVHQLNWPAGDLISSDVKVNFGSVTTIHKTRYTPCSLDIVLAEFHARVYVAAIDGATQPTLWIDRSLPGREPGWLDSCYSSVAFSNDGGLLGFGFRGTFELWSWPSRTRIGEWRVPGKSPAVFQIGFSPNGEYLAIALDRSTVVYRVSDLV